MTTLIIIMAPPGAGKSELAEYLYNKNNNSIIINRNNFEDSITYYQTINKFLGRKKIVILDSHTVLYQDRMELFDNLKLEDTKIIGIWVEVSKKEAKERNIKKPLKEQFTSEELDFLFKYKISPMPNEPFDDLIYIMRDADVGMSKSYPYIASTFETLDRI